MEVKTWLKNTTILIILTSIVTGYNRREAARDASFQFQSNFSNQLFTSDCVDTITCGSEPFIAKCTTCDPRFFYCKESGASPIEMKCPSGQLFNPVPLYAKCILSDSCPYYPPWTVPTTPSFVTTDAKCVDTVICGSALFVAKCTFCDPRFFYCEYPGAKPVEYRCPAGQFFNTDPLYAKCILLENCPYHPPWTITSTSTTTTPITRLPTTTTVAPTTTPSTTTTTTSTTISTRTTASSTTTTSPTTTTKSTTTTTTTPKTQTTTTPFSGCLDKLECVAKGDFARCNYCQETYFRCEEAGLPGTIKLCMDNEVFNIDPAYARCVLASECPYHPTTPSSSSSVISSTSTAQSDTASTSTNGPTPECWESIECPKRGNFPKCNFCFEEYFFCEDKGSKPIPKVCIGMTMFNTNPNDPYCVAFYKCPYYPDSLQ